MPQAHAIKDCITNAYELEDQIKASQLYPSACVYPVIKEMLNMYALISVLLQLVYYQYQAT